MRTLV